MKLRDYQQRSIDQIYAWFGKHKTGNPCAVLPTGAGKSLIIAELCRDALQNWPETRVLMLTHQKELIQQNADKVRAVWPGAPLGIYSASLRRRDAGEPITFAGIQSVRTKAQMLGWVDIVIIDECHLINNDQQGGYRALLADLMQINPGLRIIGLTATPYRLGQGMLTDGDDALFSDIIEPVTIEELLFKGYLAPLRSKQTSAKLDVSGVKKRGGEFIESELAKAIDTQMCNQQAVQEIISRAGDRKSWLVFCSGVDHAQHICDELRSQGIESECLTGGTPKRQREEMLDAFKAKEIRALTNANILTTGFDAPDTDLVAMLRPTMSPALYVQMAGRGLRPKSHTDHCLVLDFAENVARHGPITAVQPPKKSGGGGEAPVKVCPQCDEVVHLSAKACPECGHEFITEEDEKRWRLANDDIMGDEGKEMRVNDWRWQPHISRTSGKEMVRVSYYGALSDPPVTEYLPILHEGYAGQRALATLASIASGSGADIPDDDLKELCESLNAATPPSLLEYMKDGRFYRVIRRDWNA